MNEIGWMERGVVALERIADALEQQTALMSTVELPVCLHPEEKRVNTSTMGHPRWTCADCGFAVGDDALAGSVHGD